MRVGFSAYVFWSFQRDAVVSSASQSSLKVGKCWILLSPRIPVSARHPLLEMAGCWRPSVFVQLVRCIDHASTWLLPDSPVYRPGAATLQAENNEAKQPTKRPTGLQIRVKRCERPKCCPCVRSQNVTILVLRCAASYARVMDAGLEGNKR